MSFYNYRRVLVPAGKEIVNLFWFWLIFLNKNKILFTDNEAVIQNHPSSCYISRKIDFSSNLNEILNQDDLSSKIIINNSNIKDDNKIVLSESLGK